MKKLNITERGIILEENNEILNNVIYNEKKDIVYEVYKLFSEYENIGEIEVVLKIQLEKNDIENIDNIIINSNGKLIKKRTIGKGLKKIILIFTLILLGKIMIFSYLFIKYKSLKRELLITNKILLKKEKDIFKIQESINLLKEELTIGENGFKKSKLFENNIERIIKGLDKNIFLEYIDINNNMIEIKGYSKSVDEVLTFEKNLLYYFNNKSIKFDYIKKRGGLIYFLIELESL
ncbi:hypothetical protein [uncultured Cetobacterium sp.]|uniref:hypothetical protein n=1 Tax=uncultured Cetobacterium sp. TaxID=527638 RepID=UPI002607BD36|nr:hypothetical protein [uncultured Cetobacterium sp.]